MLAFLLRRLVWMVPTFVGITLLTFAIARMAPGDPLELGIERPAQAAHAAEAVEAFRQAQGLDRPLLVQYGRWLGRVLTLDFGTSTQDHRPVWTRIGEALPRTLLISLLTLLLAVGLSIPLGVRLSLRDHGLVGRWGASVLVVLYSLPVFWVAVTVLMWLSVRWHWFPLQGLTSSQFESLSGGEKALDLIWHLTLPVACLTIGVLASSSHYVRTAMIDALGQPFILAAKAKGLSPRRVLYRHALRYALVPMVGLWGGMIPRVLGGSVIIERVFGIQGMGQLAFEAIFQRDYPVVMGTTTLVALVTLFSMLLTDLLLAWVDPRIRLGEGG